MGDDFFSRNKKNELMINKMIVTKMISAIRASCEQ